MNKKERDILKRVVQSNEGLISPATLINSFAQRDRQSVENLVAKGYLELVPEQVGDHMVNFYRVKEKGLIIFSSLINKIWFYLKEDLRTIIISIITTVLTVVVGNWLGK